MTDVDAFLEARNFLIARREQFEDAYTRFRSPALDRFNWALDYFDAIAVGNTRPALLVLADDGILERRSFDDPRDVRTASPLSCAPTA